ncbi:MAG: alpha/beta hydrolase [Bacteroidota bacterium]
MKQLIITPLLIFICQVAFAQTIYQDSVFTEVTITTHTYRDTLQFDYYMADDNHQNVPLIVLVHGGGFVGGARNSDDMVHFAKRLAHRGYAVASVSYRLTMVGIGFGCDVARNAKIQAINDASYDIELAVKYLIENSKTFNFDQSKVVLLGSSAGAEAVLNMVYVREQKAFDFNYAGIISLAGAIVTLDHIDSKTAIPSQFFHGTGDELVPYQIAPHHYCQITDKGYMMLHGSKAIADRLKGLGKSYYLYSVSGGSHSWATLPMTKCLEEITDFMVNDVIRVKSVRQTERMISE